MTQADCAASALRIPHRVVVLEADTIFPQYLTPQLGGPLARGAVTVERRQTQRSGFWTLKVLPDAPVYAISALPPIYLQSGSQLEVTDESDPLTRLAQQFSEAVTRLHTSGDRGADPLPPRPPLLMLTGRLGLIYAATSMTLDVVV